MFIGRKVNSKASHNRKGATSLPSRTGYSNTQFKGKFRPNAATGQNMYKIPNPSFNYKNRTSTMNSSNETPMEVYLKSVDNQALARISDANERKMKKP